MNEANIDQKCQKERVELNRLLVLLHDGHCPQRDWDFEGTWQELLAEIRKAHGESGCTRFDVWESFPNGGGHIYHVRI